MLDRRKFLVASAAAGALVSSPGLVRRARASTGLLKVGIPVPISGGNAANGKFASMGAILAAEEASALYGRQIRTYDLDTEGRPATAVRRVQDAMAWPPGAALRRIRARSPPPRRS